MLIMMHTKLINVFNLNSPLISTWRSKTVTFGFFVCFGVVVSKTKHSKT